MIALTDRILISDGILLEFNAMFILQHQTFTQLKKESNNLIERKYCLHHTVKTP